MIYILHGQYNLFCSVQLFHFFQKSEVNQSSSNLHWGSRMRTNNHCPFTIFKFIYLFIYLPAFLDTGLPTGNVQERDL